MGGRDRCESITVGQSSLKRIEAHVFPSDCLRFAESERIPLIT